MGRFRRGYNSLGSRREILFRGYMLALWQSSLDRALPRALAFLSVISARLPGATRLEARGSQAILS